MGGVDVVALVGGNVIIIFTICVYIMKLFYIIPIACIVLLNIIFTDRIT